MAESAQITELRTRIAEARTAYHKLVLGDQTVEVQFGSNRLTRWTPAKVSELRAYISQLEGELAALLGGIPRGPIYPMGLPR